MLYARYLKGVLKITSWLNTMPTGVASDPPLVMYKSPILLKEAIKDYAERYKVPLDAQVIAVTTQGDRAFKLGDFMQEYFPEPEPKEEDPLEGLNDALGERFEEASDGQG